MLFYKAWRESRTRFAIAAGALLVFSIAFVIGARTSFPLPQNPRVPYSAFVWGTFYGGFRPAVFSYVALVLSLGGLQRERAGGTAPFTLTLPVSRFQLLLSRAIVGLLELLAIAIIPTVVVPALSPVFAHQSYPAVQSLKFALLFMSWGCVWFGIGLLWSIIFSSEYTATAATVLTPWVYLVIYSTVSKGGRLYEWANPFHVMSGGLDAALGGRSLLVSPLPWMEIIALAGIAAATLALADRLTMRQDF